MPGGLVGELVKFSQWTSCHGIPHMGSSRKLALTIMWGVLVFISSIFVIYYVDKLVKKYMSHPINVQSEIKFEQLPFPAVTICNLNPIRKSQVKLVPELEKLLMACDLPATKRDPNKKPTNFCETRRGSYRSMLPKGH